MLIFDLQPTISFVNDIQILTEAERKTNDVTETTVPGVCVFISICKFKEKFCKPYTSNLGHVNIGKNILMLIFDLQSKISCIWYSSIK